MADRLLTPEEIKFYHKCYSDESHEHWFYTPKRIAEAQDIKTRADTLREVVEYFEKHRARTQIHRGICYYAECYSWEIEKGEWQAKLEEWGYKQGKMPEES